MSKDRKSIEELEIEAPESMIEELRRGWKKIVETAGMENLTFHRYITACVMYGHWNLQKCTGLLAIMLEESDRAGREKE